MVYITNRPYWLIEVRILFLNFVLINITQKKIVMCGIMTATNYISYTGGLKFDFCNRIAYNRYDLCINSVYGYEQFT